MKKVILSLLVITLLLACSQKEYTNRESDNAKNLITYIKSFSYVKGVVLADNGGLIIAVTPNEKNADMLANSFINSASTYKVKIKYCKIVSSVGAKKNGNYITGKKLSFKTANQP